MPTRIMASLDPNGYWERNANSTLRELVEGERGCLDLKIHVPFPGTDLLGTIKLLKSGPPIGKRRTILVDDKLFDVPDTVSMRVRSVFQMGATHITVQACGGRRMLAAAVEAAKWASQGGEKRTIVAVLVPTGMTKKEVKESFGCTRQEALLRFAPIARESNIEDIVCGVPDIPVVKAALSAYPETRIWAVGIRPKWHPDAGSQIEMGTPKEASDAGAHLLISGSALLSKPKKGQPFKPRDRFNRMLKEIMR